MRINAGWLWLVLLSACSANEGGSKPIVDGSDNEGGSTPIAGGQSGTDSQGAYGCLLDNAIIESIPFEQAPMGVACSPNAEFAQLEGSHVFQCKEHDVRFTVNVARGGSARRLTGESSSDTGEGTPPTACYLMRLDASVQIQGSDGSVDFAGPTTLTVDHLCSSAKIDAKVQGTEGEHRFEFFKENLFVIFPGPQTEHCPPATEPSARGDAGG